MTDTLNAVKKRKKELANSYRGCKVVFTIEEAPEDHVQYEKKACSRWNK